MVGRLFYAEYRKRDRLAQIYRQLETPLFVVIIYQQGFQEQERQFANQLQAEEFALEWISTT